MPAAEGVANMIPNRVLRVGQTVRLEGQEAVKPQPSGHHDDELNLSLDKLNQLILELDPTFEPIQVPKSPLCVRSPAADDSSHFVLVPRGCAAGAPPTRSPSVAVPAQRCSPAGALAFSSSPTRRLPPLPCGSSRRPPASSQGSLRPSRSNRSSASSSCSDTSYMLGSNLSLAGEDADSPESIFVGSFGSSSDGSRAKRGPQEPSGRAGPCAAASPSGSWTDVPVLLVNGAPQPDPGPDFTELLQTVLVSNPKPPSPHSLQSRFHGSQPSMKFVMDTSKFWFRPHVSRAEAEALVKDKEAGTFVVRDSTSYRGSFGLAMKVNQSPSSSPACPGESGSDLVRHFLIESSAKGVRIKGSSQEPYFGSLSALVYQHTITAYALPCRLLLHPQEPGTADDGDDDESASKEKNKLACNFIYLNTVSVEMLTGPCAVHKAASSTLASAPGSLTPTVVNLKVSPKGVTLTDINRKLFFRRHYPAHLLSYCGEDPDARLWLRGTSFGARMFGFVAKGTESGRENVCHIFAEHDPLQPCNKVVEVVQAAIAKL
ncbi:tensin-4 [Betta splendens]|uniref:Tensin-4 n=1 Tax=Betta splendens TaxID=158456 RepID=A0A6P7MN08_BETSP|nr:tensin-4 [Betta splendens]